MAKKNYWYFNTDETEAEGENAYQEMISGNDKANVHCRLGELPW